MAESELESLPAIEARLGKYLELSDQLIAAVAESNELRVREALARLRNQRDVVSRMERLVEKRKIPETADGVRALRKWMQTRKTIAAHDQVIHSWLQALQRPEAEMLATPLGVQRFVDRSLPLEWNVLCDLVVLIGTNCQAVAAELLQRGQQRIFVCFPSTERPQGFPTGVSLFRNAAELRVLMLALYHGPQPNKMVFWRLEGAFFSDAQVEELQRTAQEMIEPQTAAVATVEAYGELWIKQGLRNLSHIASRPSVVSLYGQFPSRPAVIVSPGPSLKKNIDLLATLKGRALIVTSVQTIAPLQKVGLVPDLSLIGDAVDMSYVLRGLPIAEIGRLAVAMSAHPSFFELGAPVFTYSANCRMEAWLHSIFGSDSGLVSGGSVSCVAFTLALLLGCDPIVLVGQDLSFTDSGEMYVASSPHAKNRASFSDDGTVEIDYAGVSAEVRPIADLSKRQEAIKLPGYYGGNVATAADFAAFHQWFEWMAEANQTDSHRRRLYNCTEGGVFIQGMEHRTLAEVAGECMSDRFDVDGPFAKAESSSGMMPGLRALAWVQQTTAQLQRAVECAQKCNALSGVALAQAEAELARALSPLQFISILDTKVLFDALERGRVAVNLEQNLGAARDLYALVLRAGAEMLPLLAEQNDRLQRLLGVEVAR